MGLKDFLSMFGFNKYTTYSVAMGFKDLSISNLNVIFSVLMYTHEMTASVRSGGCIYRARPN